MGLFETVYVAGLILIFIIRWPYAWRTKENRVSVYRQTLSDTLLVSLAGLSMVLPVVAAYTSWLSFADYAVPEWARWLGVAILAFGVWLFWRSHADLGLNWSPILKLRKGHQLVTTGSFERIRHPMYAAIWLIILAQSVLVPNWVATLAFAAFFGVLYWTRVPNEERMMLDSFGGRYRAYMARTGRVIPRLA